jgi:hypothetical protein
VSSDITTLVPIVGAVVAAVTALVVLWVSGLRVERARRRQAYAEALEATLAYREFAYAVRRRRHDAPSEERVRLSEGLREVQRDIARHEALMRIERAGRVAATYRRLVAKTREVAGGYIRQAWNSPPIEADEQMSVPGGLDFSTLDPFEAEFLDAVRHDLAWWRFWR